MKYKVSMTRRADDDRIRAFEWYVANSSTAFATRWFNGITRAMHSLANMPERCHKARENYCFPFELYELLYGKRSVKYRILFRIYKDMVLVLHIRHSAQSDMTADDL